MPGDPTLGFGNSDNEDWEVVDSPDIRPEDGATSSLSLAFTWHYGFTLQRGGNRTSRVGLGESKEHECKMSTVPKNCASSLNKQDQCMLFSLPFELRLRIYEEVLLIQALKVQLRWYPTNQQKNHPISVLSILVTCQRIHAEAESIFYSINHFKYQVEESRLNRNFFQAISSKRRDAIKKITITVSSGSEALAILSELSVLTGLQELQMERQQSIRFTDIGAWVVLAKQLRMELEKLVGLKELDIITPPTITPTPDEEQRMQRLDKVDASLREVIAKKCSPVT
ncbi:hypothetical protein TARUN_5745 [Trichoderma arundinaceum]|uniref:Uncharacterized protein n=1 Tax=Trichoderma arundinaceum TaxID=490622 RepID=A0A395NKB5_TRIAR|nr:hypothetical protein TARUN_5745 [Trichoderma arundinaceum]